MPELKEIIADKSLIAACGLYCGACRTYLNGRCPGCFENDKASWCKIRQCCMENNFLSCADCKSVELMECRKFNNIMSKAFGFIFNSDREACIQAIRENGYDKYAVDMAALKMQTIKRKKK
jgi:hypothetical protein